MKMCVILCFFYQVKLCFLIQEIAADRRFRVSRSVLYFRTNAYCSTYIFRTNSICSKLNFRTIYKCSAQNVEQNENVRVY